MAILVGVVNVLLAVVLFLQYRLNRNRGFAGLGWWAVGQGCVAAGLALSAARAASGAGQLAIPLFQVLIVIGTGAVVVGLQRFVGRRERLGWLVALAAAFIAWATYFTYVDDRIVLRSVALYSTVAFLYLGGAWTLVRHGADAIRVTARATAVVLAVGAASYLALALAWVAQQPIDGGFSTPPTIIPMALLASLSATVLSTFGLVAMVNQRLSAEIEVDARNMHNVFATSPDGSMISRLGDGQIDDVNEGFTRLTGFSRAEALGRTTLELGLWVDGAARERYVHAVAEQGSVTDFPMVLRRKDATTVECMVAGSTLTLHDEAYLISVVRDVTEQRRLEAELLHEASTDSLTGLPNRREFMAVFQRELHRAGRSGACLAVAVIDIDNFKTVNDTYGHAAGDQALVSFSRTVTSIIRDVDTCGRLGGDEFALLLPDADLDHAVAALERIRRELAKRPFTADGQALHITISAGVAAAQPDRDTVDVVLVRADGALYEAKECGRNQLVVVSPHTPG